MKNNTLVVTGSSGFVGSNLARCAVARGENVLGIDTSKLENAEFEQIQMDLTDPNLSEVIPNNSRVVHLAAISTDNGAKNDPIQTVNTNILATTNLINVINSKFDSSITFASSEWVYGERTTSLQNLESDRLEIENLDSFYAISKLIGENLFRVLCRRPYAIYRFGIVYGPRTEPGSALEAVALQALKFKKVAVGSADTARRFIFIDDLVEALIIDNTSEIDRKSAIFNVSGDQLIDLRTVAKITGEIINSEIEIEETGNQPSIRNPINDKFRETFRWGAKVDLKTGINLCLNQMQRAK